MKSANDSLKEHMSAGMLYNYMLGMVITDGVKELADRFKCYWFVDVVVSYQPELQGEEFQVWKLQKTGESSAIVTCEDGNDNILKSQVIEYTDFEPDEATVWVEFNVILLPSEH
jgi:hypothetical protein